MLGCSSSCCGCDAKDEINVPMYDNRGAPGLEAGAFLGEPNAVSRISRRETEPAEQPELPKQYEQNTQPEPQVDPVETSGIEQDKQTVEQQMAILSWQRKSQEVEDAMAEEKIDPPPSEYCGSEFIVEVTKTPDMSRVGLDVDHGLEGALHVIHVKEGLIKTYNASVGPEKQIREGDRIVQVNEVTGDNKRMLETVGRERELKFIIRRADPS